MAHQLIRRALGISGATIHWYDKPGRNLLMYTRALFTISSLHFSLNNIFFLFFLCNDIVEMRKQRKMGHITVVGPSMSIVEARVKSMLKDESMDDQPTGLFLTRILITIYI